MNIVYALALAAYSYGSEEPDVITTKYVFDTHSGCVAAGGYEINTMWRAGFAIENPEIYFLGTICIPTTK